MKIRKEQAWLNRKCNECGRQIYTTKKDIKSVYVIELGFTIANKWRLCESCFKKIFPEEYKKIK